MAGSEHVAYLLLGANLGEREVTLGEARRRLQETDCLRTLGQSAIYESPAEGMAPGAPHFLNQALEINTSLSANELLDVCEDIEREFGRTHKREMRSRTLDVDILLYGGKVIETARLKIPHERLTERGFALIPLVEICPDITDPRNNRRLDSHITAEMRRNVSENATHA